MRIFITGGAGFIGAHLANHLAEKHDVVVYDNLRCGDKNKLSKKINFIQGDIINYYFLKKSMKGSDIVCHLAAIPRVGYSIRKPFETFKVNVTGTHNVLMAAKTNGVKKIIFASSSTVYGNSDFLAKLSGQREGNQYSLLCPYAAHKGMCELYMTMFTNLYKIPTISLRLFSVYGKGSDNISKDALVIGKFIKLAKEGKELTVYGDGTQKRDFTHVSDVVNAFEKAINMKTDKAHIFNIGSAKPISINRLISLVKKEIKGVKIKKMPVRIGDSDMTFADISNAKKSLSWKPKIKFSQGLKNMMKSKKLINKEKK